MALAQEDLLVVQKAGGGELRKISVAGLLSDVDGGGAEVIISDTAPDFAADSLEPGTLWWASNEGNLYILYTDNDSTQWVSAVSTVGGSEDEVGNVNTYSATEPAEKKAGDMWYQPYSGVAGDGSGTLQMYNGTAWYKTSAPCDFRGLPVLP